MNCKQPKFQILPVAAVILIIAGCNPQTQQNSFLCPGKKSAVEALSTLNCHSGNAVSLKANGQCRLHYYTNQKLQKENFPVKLWLNPPSEIYLQGDVAFDPRAIAAGSNENEFWLAIKLKEISTYWCGIWSEQVYPKGLGINPKLLLEAFGVTELDNEQYWSLANAGSFDVLTKRSDEGMVIEKLYVNKCDYLVRRIEYFDAGHHAGLVVELDKYKEISEGFFAPTVIKIVRHQEQKGEETVRIILGSVKQAVFSDKQQNILFNRPEPRGFKHIYKIAEDGNVIEQPQ